MNEIQARLKQVMSDYLYEKATYITARKTVPLYSVVVQELPKLFTQKANIPHKIKVQGSIGRGVITETPWICFFDKEITTSAQRGYYLCILFREDMKGFYLSLNQGWTQYQKSYGVKQGKAQIKSNSAKARSILRSISGFETSELDLDASKYLGMGYEQGNIFSRYYSADEVPSDANLFEDLQILLGAYRELKGVVGSNILDIQSLSSEEDFQLAIQTAEIPDLPPGPISKPNKRHQVSVSNWARDPKNSAAALNNADNRCEFDKSHTTFISKRSGNNFVEAHHLIPMEKQAQFEFSLDVPENIIALCPNCHRKIHYGSHEEKAPMIEALYHQRQNGLTERGINISATELKAIYKQEELLDQEPLY